MISTQLHRSIRGLFLVSIAAFAGVPEGLGYRCWAQQDTHEVARDAASETVGETLSIDTLVARLKSIEESPLDEVWTEIASLNRLALRSRSDPVPLLKAHLEELTGRSRLAGAALLLERRESFEDGRVTLQRLAREPGQSTVRVAAIRLLGQGRFSESLFFSLSDLYRNSKNVQIRIEAARALLRLDDSESVRRNLVPPLLELLTSTEWQTRESAALALAEAGEFRPEVNKALRAISKQPTPNGRLAATLYAQFGSQKGGVDVTDLRRKLRNLERENDQLQARVEGGTPNQGAKQEAWVDALREVLELVERRSLYSPEIETRNLFKAALYAFAASIDEYSRLLTGHAAERVVDGQVGTYWGIGVRLVKVNDEAEPAVARAYRGGPAFKAGLRAGDRLLEINGVPTQGLRLEDVRRIRGDSDGTGVRLRVLGWSRDEPHDVTVAVAAGEPSGVDTQVFPERIGYVRVPRFTAAIPEAVDLALQQGGKQCAAGGGTSGWILDLRDNPGGSLEAAIRVVDLFVDSEEPIVTLRNAAGVPSVHRAHEGARSDRPVVVLVNSLTASAAEVVAGALQAFGRATVVGERTFGKGVEQKFFPLPETAKYLDTASGLWLTQRRFYLPPYLPPNLPRGRPLQSERRFSTNSFLEGSRGIAPDVTVPSAAGGFRGAELDELERVMFSAAMHSYIRKHYTLIRGDLDCGSIRSDEPYPGLDDLRREVETPLSPEGLAHAVRRLLRRRLEDETGRRLASDYTSNRQLQRAILEILRAIHVGPAAIPEYAPFAEKHGTENHGTGED